MSMLGTAPNGGVPAGFRRKGAADERPLEAGFKRGADGLFEEPEWTDELLVEEDHNRERFANHFKYADEHSGKGGEPGNPKTFDRRGTYLCGHCNQVEGAKCELVKIKSVNRRAGSCGEWEQQDEKDAELHLEELTPSQASYGVAKDGVGFGCVRCPFSKKAREPDKLGRSGWCGKGAFRQTPTGCCRINGNETVPESDPRYFGEGAEPKQARDSAPKTLYVNRPLLNARDLIAWARKAGFEKTLPADDVHVTLAHSKTPVDWSATSPQDDEVNVEGSTRSIERLGDKGAVCLRFESPELTERWRQLRDLGAAWDFPGYKPHVTITYDAGDLDLSAIAPYDGPLDFGPEVFAEVDLDWADKVKANLATDSAILLALDRSPENRTYDRDGRMKITRTHLTKACVSPYRGKEIPRWEELGLDPDKIYELLRDPEELERAAHTINGVPLLEVHKPVSAKDPAKEIVVGSVGSSPEWDGEYLDNALFVTDAKAIKGIESERKRELSAGYHYRADMTPGIFRGKRYDGVMRDIEFNHVTLVEDGRAGPDILAADSKEGLMTAKRFGAFVLQLTRHQLAPCIAMDQKIQLSTADFANLTRKDFSKQRPKLLETIKAATDGKLRKGMAFDQTMLAKLLEEVEGGTGEGADESVSEPQHKAMEAAAHGESALDIPKGVGEEFSEADEAAGKTTPKAFDAEPVKAWMKEHGATDEEIAGMFPKPATDADMTDEEKAKAEKEKADKAAADKKAQDEATEKNMVSKPAMDEALKTHGDAVEKRVMEKMRGVHAAISEVKPWVGEIAPTVALALDSAESVRRHALKLLGHPKHATLHADALSDVIGSYPKPGARPVDGASKTLALDSKAVDRLAKISPDAAAISAV